MTVVLLFVVGVVAGAVGFFVGRIGGPGDRELEQLRIQAGADQLVHFMQHVNVQLDPDTTRDVFAVAVTTYSGEFRDYVHERLRLQPLPPEVAEPAQPQQPPVRPRAMHPQSTW